MSIVFPEPFAGFLRLLSVLQLDFLSLDCATGQNSFVTRVLVVSLVPIILIFFDLVVYLVRRFCSKQLPLDKAASEHAYFALVLSYAVLPACSTLLFQSLSCRTFDNSKESILVVDSAIDCNSDEYKALAAVVIGFIFVYLSIPVVWFVLLWKTRESLNPPDLPLGSKLKIRDHDPSIRYLAFLFMDYYPDCW